MMMRNYLRAVEKNKDAPPSTPSRLQGKEKRSKTSIISVAPTQIPIVQIPIAEVMAATAPIVQADTPSTAITTDPTWKTAISRKQKNTDVKTKRNNLAKKKLLSDSDDSDSEAEEDEELKLLIPDPQDTFLLHNQSVSFRFTFVMDIDSSLEPTQFLQHSVSKLNKVTKGISTMGQLQGYTGRAVMIPWEDKDVFFNRAWPRVKRSTGHTMLLTFIKHILYGFGAPKGRKQDTKIAKKFCRVQLAWVSSEVLETSKLDDLLHFLRSVKISDPDSFTLYPAPTEAINPTIAVQFRNSIVSNPSNWTDKGHEDCLQELNKMVRSFLPPGTTAGLKKVTFATGQNFMRGDPTMMTLECEKHDEAIVTRDILNALRSANRRSQIKDRSSVPWIAIPYFKGHGIQSNQKYASQYLEIKIKESFYQDNVTMRYIEHVHSLDSVASDHFYLSKEFLKQLEQDIWNRNETPVRALIYDKLWEETRKSLIDAELSRLNNPSEKVIASVSKKVTYHQILDEMAKKGYETLAPYDEYSFPVSNPSKRTLREYLMSMKSRRVENATDAPYLFESINMTDDGRVLCSFAKVNTEEATTVLDCLPLMIQQEMHLDPSCFLNQSFMKSSIGSYYNPLTRTGFTAFAACLQDDIKPQHNPKQRIPKGIRNASAVAIEHIFKRKENKMFTFMDDSDLASIAGSIASYKIVTTSEKPSSEEHITNLQMLLQTHHLGKTALDDVSNLSDGSSLSFDSKASKNKYEIERRADQMASKQVEHTVRQLKMQQGLKLLSSGVLTKELATTLDLPYEEILKASQQPDIPIPNSIIVDEVYLDAQANDPLVMVLPDSIMDDEVYLDAQASDPLVTVLPDSDNDSDATPIRKSPHKNMAADGHNVGNLK